MVAAMPLPTVSHTNLKTVTTTDLRNIAIGLAAAIALIVVAGQIAASDSASVSALDDKSEARFAAGFVSVAASDATYGIGDSLIITATWDSAVSVTGVPTFSFV